MTSPSTEHPMVKVAARDIVPVAWRLAREFARPDRAGPVVGGLAVVMTPMFVLLVAVLGAFHWERRAVLSVLHEPSWRVVAIVWSLLAVGLLAIVSPTWTTSHVPRIVVGALAALAVLSCAAGAVAMVAARAMGRRGRARRELRAEPTSGMRLEASALAPALAPASAPAPALATAPARARWVVSFAAAVPGLDAVSTCFEPLLRVVVPAGETVEVNAVNQQLAALYRGKGFRPVGRNPLKLRLTMPGGLDPAAAATSPVVPNGQGKA